MPDPKKFLNGHFNPAEGGGPDPGGKVIENSCQNQLGSYMMGRVALPSTHQC